MTPRTAAALLLASLLSPVVVASPRDARRLGIALVTEDRKAKGLHLEASIRDNVTLPSLSRLARFGVRSARGEARMADDAVRRLGVRCTGIDQVAATLSGGNQQKVVIAKSLAQDPDVIVFDEPTRGVDVGAIAEIHELIDQLADQGKAVVMISSYLPEIMARSDRILVCRQGKVVEEFSARDATEEKIMYAAIH